MLRVTCLLVVIGGTSLVAAEQGAEKEPGGFASPQEAWEAYRHARHEGQWRKAYRCLTPESQGRFVEVIVYMGAYLQGTDDKDTARKLNGVLNNHGLDPERIYEETKGWPHDDYVKELNRHVKDREGLFHEAMTIMARAIPQPKGKNGKRVIAYGGLTRVHIAGDRATGEFVKKLDEKAVIEVDRVRQTERRVRVRFRKIDGRWFCIMKAGY